MIRDFHEADQACSEHRPFEEEGRELSGLDPRTGGARLTRASRYSERYPPKQS